MTETKEVYNTIHLSAESSREVANDLMKAQVYVMQTGNDPRELADQVNRVLNAGRQTAESAAAVRVQSGNYETRPMTHWDDLKKEMVQTGWQATASLLLESEDFRQLGDLIGRLQGEMQLGQVEFTVSPRQQEMAENDLMVEAIRAFNTRAQIVGKTLGATEHKLKDMTVQTAGRNSRPNGRMAYALAAGAPATESPQFSEGTSRVTVTINGTIELMM